MGGMKGFEEYSGDGREEHLAIDRVTKVVGIVQFGLGVAVI